MENRFVVKTKTSDKCSRTLEEVFESFVSLDNKNLDDEVLMETMKTDGKQSKGCVQLDEGSMEVLESKTSCGRKTKGNVPKRKHYRWKNSVVSHNFYDNHDGDDESSPRHKVKELLFLFRKLLQEDADAKEERPCHRRVDYQIAVKRLEDEKKILNTDLKPLGHVPGVEVGDAFKCRMELSILGLHRQTKSGISCSKHGGKNVAASIVASEDRTDDLDDSSVMVYTGQGGSTTNSDKKLEDQKLEGGNLALTNSMVLKTPIKVIRYVVVIHIRGDSGNFYKLVTGPHGNLVYKFWLERIPGQPEIVCKEIERTRRLKTKKVSVLSILGEPKAAQKGVKRRTRYVKRRKRSESKKGVCLDDISHGKELIPIRAVNTIDDEKPPSFKYATNLVYPDWCHITPPKSCDCIDGCSDSKTCSCAVNNGGEMPYSSNGTAVDGKLFLYECGPSCKCPPSCHNRVSQYGFKIKLEHFKTKLRGWGLRSRECIPLGGFICDYDDYLFDIGKNHDSNTNIDKGLNNCKDVDDDSGFTIDAAGREIHQP
ncbi:hypothetical protein G4B88_027523 [Cannabis sativa]|uniref:Uncharacterized protein n=1 Tax=Cannabis sativa TaxID=3483 RepID=A0A7J6G642_CANSA|nr:hypothetical protein G4B88_027523 [Cannabis sativa]